MTQKKSFSLTKAIYKIITIVPAVINLFFNVTTLIGIEARLAGRALLYLAILAIFAACLLATTWICLLGMLFIYLTSLHLSALLCLLVLAIINVCLIVIILICMTKLKRNLTFPVTRSQFSQLRD